MHDRNEASDHDQLRKAIVARIADAASWPSWSPVPLSTFFEEILEDLVTC